MSATRYGRWMAAIWACAVLGCAGSTHGGEAASSRGANGATRPPPELRASAFAGSGLSWLERGDYVRAEQYLQLAWHAGHPEAELIGPLLQACIASNRFRAALAHADRYLARHARAWRVRYVKSALLRALGQPVAARQELQRVVGDAPRSTDAQRLLEQKLGAVR